MANLSLWDMPFADIRYQDVEAFLQLHSPEGERIEYKRHKTDNISDTLVSMSNTSGGLMFIGVEEDNRTKRPTSWDHLELTDKTDVAVFDQCASDTMPTIRPLVKTVISPKDPTRCMVLAKILPGDNPPYYSLKRKVVFVRVGDGDQPADLRTLEMLFRGKLQERSGPSKVEDRQILNWKDGPSGRPNPVWLRLVIGPKRDMPAMSFGSQSQRMIERAIDEWFAGSDRSSRSSVRIVYRVCAHDLAIRNDGLIAWALPLVPLQDNEAMIDGFNLSQLLFAFLPFSTAIYRTVFDYLGVLQFGATLNNVYDRELKWLHSTGSRGVSYVNIRRSGPPSGNTHWQFLGEHIVGTDLRPLAREAIKDLAFNMNYDNYEDYIDNFFSGGPDIT